MTVETHYSTTFSVHNKPDDIIQTAPVSMPHIQNKTITTVNDNSQLFETPPKNNHIVTTTSDKVFFYLNKCNIKTITQLESL